MVKRSPLLEKPGSASRVWQPKRAYASLLSSGSAGWWRRLCLVFQRSAHHTNAPLYPIVRGLEETTAIRKLGYQYRADRSVGNLPGSASCGVQPIPLCALVDLLGLKADERYPPLSTTPAEKRRLTIEALSVWCASLCAGRSLIIVFEDVQWIDPTSKLFLSRLSRWAKDNPALIMVTLRSDDAPDFGPAGPGRLDRTRRATLPRHRMRDAPTRRGGNQDVDRRICRRQANRSGRSGSYQEEF